MNSFSMNQESPIKSVLLAFRPKTLTAAFVPCVVGTAYASSTFASWSLKYFIFALLSATFIQIGTNLINDAIDFKKGADTKERIGPQRITQSGVLSYKVVLSLGSLSFALSALFGLPLVMSGGLPIVIIGVLSILLGYGYTAGPYPLAYKGLGDLFVIIFFGLVAVCGMIFLHAKTIDVGSFILGLQIGLLATILIAINNLRDLNGDKKVNKLTLAVRLGEKHAKQEIYFLILSPFLLGIYWLSTHDYLSFFFPLLTVPLAIKLFKNIKLREPGPIYNNFLAQAAALHLLFGLLISLGFSLKWN
ncbi:MAG: 1,4-dihydroxy-2-naphthoate octaprenyltransferase [Bdellovibrionaceae bacterium]|nr:1,4-dihydroxy-2-naphthoate octaprenyltransferase [Pseudobdellovibrionaceae bacterium]